jgi:hypothetical protein
VAVVAGCGAETAGVGVATGTGVETEGVLATPAGELFRSSWRSLRECQLDDGAGDVR